MSTPVYGEVKDDRITIFMNEVDDTKPIGKFITYYGTQKWNDGCVYGWGVGCIFGVLLGSFLGPLVFRSIPTVY